MDTAARRQEGVADVRQQAQTALVDVHDGSDRLRGEELQPKVGPTDELVEHVVLTCVKLRRAHDRGQYLTIERAYLQQVRTPKHLFEALLFVLVDVAGGVDAHFAIAPDQ